MALQLVCWRKLVLHTYTLTVRFMITLIIFFHPQQLMAFSAEEEEYFLQAEYALIDGDSIQAEIIFRYLIKHTSSSKFKKLSLMRLYSINHDIELSSIPLEKNKKDAIFLQLLLDKKVWDYKKVERFKDFPISPEVDFENRIEEIKKISCLINLGKAEQFIFFKKETAFIHQLINESKSFHENYLKGIRNSILHQETIVELVTFFYDEIINQFFLSEVLSEQKNKNSFYFDYRKYLSLIELNKIKASFFSKQYYSESLPIWKEQLIQIYDILFFLQKKIFQTGLFNPKRKKYIRNKFNIQESAIIFYQQQYYSSRDKKWMQKALAVMENIKSSLLVTKGMYYNSEDLLKDLCRNIIAEIEKKESFSSMLINDKERLAYINLQSNISQQYNYFYKIHQFRKQEQTKFNLKALKKNCLPSNTKNVAIINYFDSKNYLFALFMDSENEILEAIPKFEKDSLVERLQYLKNTFSSPAGALHANKRSLNEFQKNAHIVYQLILQPLFVEGIPRNLIIIPDGLLNYIPFETFVLEDTFLNTQKVPYLVQQAAIRYYPSLKMFSKYESVVKKTITIQSISSFAPSYKPSKELMESEFQLPQLRGTTAEVKSITQRFQLNKSDQNFNRIGKPNTSKANRKLLHLSMHAASEFDHRKEPGLIISNQKKEVLFLHDIARLPSVPAVVVLSACDTGLGDYISGEGLKSIGHQFLQSGAKSTIQSLNKVADVSSFQLIDEFYKNIKKEDKSPRALQQSKIHFLQKADAFYAHPYFWGGFVSYGQPFVIGHHKKTWGI